MASTVAPFAALPTLQQVVDGEWIAVTNFAPTQANEADFNATIAAALKIEGVSPISGTSPVDINAAFALASNTTFQAKITALITQAGGDSAKFLNLLSSDLSGTGVTITAESIGMIGWLNSVSATATPAGWAGVAAIFVEAVLGTWSATSLTTAGLSAADIQTFTDQHQAALNRALIGNTYAAALATNSALGLDSLNSLILTGVDQNPSTLQNAQLQISTGKITGQAPTFTLTTGLDIPPAFQTSLDNAVFSSSDVILSGIVAQTLNPGDHLVSTGKNATLDLFASSQSTGIHNFSGFQTDGVPNLHIHNSDAFGLTLEASGMNGLTTIQSSNAVTGGFVTLNNVPNQVTLNVDGSVDFLTLNYTNPVTGTQNLGLTNAHQNPGTQITFGTNAPTTLAVHFTGSSTVEIFDPVATTITADTPTDTTGGTNFICFDDGGNNTVTSVNLSAVKGALTFNLEDDALGNIAVITLGTNDTLNIGNSNNAPGNQVTVNGAPNGLYNITLGNQQDIINLGAHSTGDTLTFVQPASFGFPPDIINQSNFGAGTNGDTYNFSVAGFNGSFIPGVSPTFCDHQNFSAGTFSQLLQAGAFSQSPVAAGASVQKFDYFGIVGSTMTQGQNLIVDHADLSLAGVNGSLGTAAPITFAGFSFGSPGAFLVAYQNGTEGVHIAEELVTGGAGAPNTSFAGQGIFAFDIADIPNANLNNLDVGHFHFIA